jgi:hypothetical protein
LKPFPIAFIPTSLDDPGKNQQTCQFSLGFLEQAVNVNGPLSKAFLFLL